MQDIRKPYSHSRSNDERLLRVERFEAGRRDEEIDDREAVHIPRTAKRRSVESMDMYPKSRSREEYPFDTDPYTPYRDDRRRSRKETSTGTWIFIATIVALVVGISLLTFVFNSATITVTPKYKDIEVHKSYTFSTEAKPGSVLYELATTTVSKSKTLPLSETKKVQAKASGKIIVYNNFDASPQKLIKNTRFESTSGKIYRITESTTVPGKKGTTPGSVEVTVYADSYGADYNTDATDFTIPGFKGTPRYTLFFGRSHGSITGGSSGDVALVSQSDLDAAKDELTLELTQEAKQALALYKGDTFVPLYDAIQVVITDNAASVMSGQTSTYTATATGYLMLAKASDLARAIASDTITEYAGKEAKLAYTSDLTFTLKKDAQSYSDASLDVLVEGKPRVILVTDIDDLKDRFVGKNRSDAAGIIQKIPSISQIEMSFFPLWLSSIPDNKDRISIVESLPKR